MGEQTIKVILPGELLSETLRMKNKGYRLAAISCTNKNGMLAALIPPRTENTELGPLETIVVVPRAATEAMETWSAQPEITYIAHAALCILPPLQREAFLFIAWEHLDFATAAKVMACSKRRVRLNVNRAYKTLAAIFAQKGLASAESSTDSTLLPIAAYFESILSHENHDSDAPVFDQLAQASAAALSEHQRRVAIPDSRSEQWASFRVHHTLLLRRIGMGVLTLAVLVLALYGNTLSPTADTSADDIQVLASVVPLDTLLKDNFKELLHD